MSVNKWRRLKVLISWIVIPSKKVKIRYMALWTCNVRNFTLELHCDALQTNSNFSRVRLPSKEITSSSLTQCMEQKVLIWNRNSILYSLYCNVCYIFSYIARVRIIVRFLMKIKKEGKGVKVRQKEGQTGKVSLT